MKYDLLTLLEAGNNEKLESFLCPLIPAGPSTHADPVQVL